MVVPLRPARFYGSSLPRPRFYTDVKFSDERVDPPISVLDPLMSWANEAHWSMGGLCLHRLRLQGKIEGNIQKLRKEREKSLKKKIENGTHISPLKNVDSPPPAPISKKRRQRLKAVDDEEEEEEDEYEEEDEEEEEEEEIEIENMKTRRNGGMKKRRRLVRKLGDDFELVATKNQRSQSKEMTQMSNGRVSKGGVALRTRSRRSKVVMEEEEEGENDEMSIKSKKIKEKNVSVTPKKRSKNGDSKGSVSPNGSRSSPRLRQKSN